MIHAADLHIDSPLRGLGRVEGAPIDDIRLATRRAFRRLVDTCLAEEASLLLLAGDVFDGEWRDFNTGLFFVRELSRLRESGARVVMIRGNHDAESVITRNVPLPEHVVSLAADAPETVVFDDLGVAVHGQSYGARAVDDNLARSYPEPIAGLVNIGLLHTNAVGSSDHQNYAPCTVAQLCDHGYHYWALGHVHQRQILARDPWVVYPGNLQGRHARETGAKGAALLEVDELAIRAVESVDLDVVRWATVNASAKDIKDSDDLLQQVQVGLRGALAGADGRPVLARVIVRGATPLHEALAANPEPFQAKIRAIAADLGPIWPEKIRFATDSLLGSGGALALIDALRAEIERLRGDPMALRELLGDLAPLAHSLAPLLEQRIDDVAEAQARLGAIETLLLGKIGHGHGHDHAGAEPTK